MGMAFYNEMKFVDLDHCTFDNLLIHFPGKNQV
jgi:hypothetical protein